MYRNSSLDSARKNIRDVSPLTRVMPTYPAQQGFTRLLQSHLGVDDCACCYQVYGESISLRSNDVPIRAFANPFIAVVESLDGHAEFLLKKIGLDAMLQCQEIGTIEYRAMAELFENAAIELECPDFGLKLARHTSDWSSMLGPLRSVMQNAATLRQSMQYCEKYLHIYSGTVHTSLEKDDFNGREYILWDLLVSDIAFPRQVTEYAIGLTFRHIKDLSNGAAKLSEIWFTHEPLADLKSYREYFGVPVQFGKPYNAIYFECSDLDMPIATRSERVFETSLGTVKKYYDAALPSLARRVRVILSGLLVLGRSSQSTVAQILSIHPRTFQRRLCEEGTTFEIILNDVRREIALRNLVDQRVPLVAVVEKLGYSEASVLTRSCYRWFNKSPRQMRKAALQI